MEEKTFIQKEQENIDKIGLLAKASQHHSYCYPIRAVCLIDSVYEYDKCKFGESDDGIWCKHLQIDGDGCNLFNNQKGDLDEKSDTD